MDLECSYHMMPNKYWFDTYTLVNSSYVMMGNDALCKVVGIGNTRVKMFDGVIECCVMLDMFLIRERI